MNTMKLNEIEKDDDIYPRERFSHRTIESYVEALKAGAKFPGIEVQKIRVQKEDGTNEVKTICLDGWHRLEAYREYNKLDDVTPIKEVDVEFWKEEILDKQEHFEELLTEATNRNRTHGIRLEDSDLKKVCKRIIKNRPLDKLVGIQKELADRFGVSEAWISKNVGLQVKNKKKERDMQIYSMSKREITHEDIAEKAGVSRPAVTKIVKKFTEKESNEVKQDRELIDFFDSLNLLETLCFHTVNSLYMVWPDNGPPEEIEKHLKLRELEEICELPHGTVASIVQKREEYRRLLWNAWMILKEEGMEMRDAVPELITQFNNLLINRVNHLKSSEKTQDVLNIIEEWTTSIRWGYGYIPMHFRQVDFFADLFNGWKPIGIDENYFILRELCPKCDSHWYVGPYPSCRIFCPVCEEEGNTSTNSPTLEELVKMFIELKNKSDLERFRLFGGPR